MQMLNRAIEDAAAFSAFSRQLTQTLTPSPEVDHPERPAAEHPSAPGKPAKRPGENRAQYRARLYAQRQQEGS